MSRAHHRESSASQPSPFSIDAALHKTDHVATQSLLSEVVHCSVLDNLICHVLDVLLESDIFVTQLNNFTNLFQVCIDSSLDQ